MSRLADTGLPDLRFRCINVVWLALPLILLGIWSCLAPRPHATDRHHATHRAMAVGVAGRD